MTLEEIIAIADAAYPDGLVGQYALTRESVGDPMAEIIVTDIIASFIEPAEDEQHLKTAADYIGFRIRELQAVAQALRVAAIKKGEPQDGR